MNSPNLFFRILPVPGADWVGTVDIRCIETGLVAELSYKSGHSSLGLGGSHKVIKGKIFDSSSLKVLYELDGHWDRYCSFLIRNITKFRLNIWFNRKPDNVTVGLILVTLQSS